MNTPGATRRAARSLLITGGSGYFGRHLARIADKHYSVTAGYRRHRDQIQAGKAIALDITDADAVMRRVAELRPDAIIHTAAANPGVNETDMDSVNVAGSQHIAQAAHQYGVRLVHISTDMVHDGGSAPYHATDIPAPTNYYGRSKAKAEAAIAAACPSAAIIRTSLIYGLEEMDRGTASFVRKLARSEPLVLFRDVIRQPVWVNTLADAALRLAFDNTVLTGVINVAGEQAIDRDRFGRLMLAWWRVEGVDSIESGLAGELPSPPPLDLRLVIKDSEQHLNMRFMGVDDVLANAV